MKNKAIFFTSHRVATVIIALSVCGCAHENRFRYRDELVEIREHSTIQILNVHASSDTEVLTIWGRSFNDVRGLDPCYLRIPGQPLILFVTGRDYDNGKAVVHLANTATHEIRDFPAYDSHIGSSIGQTGPSSERVTDVQDNILVIEAAGFERRSKYFIDLKVPRFIREEADHPSAYPPHDWVHEVYEGGKVNAH